MAVKNMPAGLVVATPNGLTGTCGSGTITATGGSSSVSLAGGTLAAGGSCTFAVNVTGTTAGAKNNTTGTVSSTETGAGATSNTATVTVAAPPTISKIEPASGPHTGGREIVLTGTGFTEGAKVKVGSSEATEVTVVSETEITAKTPAGTAGKAEVTVTDSKGTSNAVAYTYT